MPHHRLDFNVNANFFGVLLFFLTLTICFISGCAPKEEGPDNVAKVIGSMTDSLPIISLAGRC